MPYTLPETAKPFTLRTSEEDIQDDRGKGDIDLHFIDIFSQRDDAIPIVLLHGWPGSFLEFIPILELLQKKYDPSLLPYHVIVPSLPGYTLSSGPSQTEAWNSKDAARVINKAVTSLGFTRYAVQGGDDGSLIAATLAATYDSVAAIHLNLLPSLDRVTVDDPSLSATDKAAIKRAEQRFLTPTTGAALLQSTRPATIGAMVSSSPMALLSWIGEKFLEWPDDAIDIDEILTNVSLYWFTDTMPRCIYTYRGTFINDHQYSFPSFKQPFGFSWFLQELIPTPKELAKKKGNLVFYQQHQKGGHFAALERPIEFLQHIEDYLGLPSRSEITQPAQLLSKSQESRLVTWILRQEALGYAPSHSQVRATVAALLRQQGRERHIGVHWLARFIKRHPDIKTKVGKRQEAARFNSFTPMAVNWYFGIRESEYGWIKRENTVNVDEGGIMAGFGLDSLVIGSSDPRRKAFLKGSQSRTWTTFIEAVTADGLEWLKEVYLPQTQPADESDARLIILDGHGSHVSDEWMATCFLNNPLDNGVFNASKAAYRKELQKLTSLTDSAPVDKVNFIKAYARARAVGMTKKNILSGWRVTGNWPISRRKALMHPEIQPDKKETTPGSDGHRDGQVDSDHTPTTSRHIRDLGKNKSPSTRRRYSNSQPGGGSWPVEQRQEEEGDTES
ncbi:uncharacterized protein FRV6_16752 [Fusarium oxysporum]|uniref:HTH CENPB-type domain-containing protein n=1 Tax=Fusarium oxysporum TaxID=5507 RepID=A0A2H3TVI7_FUSOX|nr:uncharacterized protein FRV6_16752 [Fusarium oxysporum]